MGSMRWNSSLREFPSQLCKNKELKEQNEEETLVV